eukprot:CAMPEP_0172844250 /NCGR_PEP_ID=MMETSP1075-20121228/32061_1 /TAXON_ID=2916 /ORGANISM="Ceratium fusus, Strain PA161109" /LENGTH=32 /DNA_ID= /DNA_START= /DNA_END= /DNA_ORIENTATION=
MEILDSGLLRQRFISTVVLKQSWPPCRICRVR